MSPVRNAVRLTLAVAAAATAIGLPLVAAETASAIPGLVTAQRTSSNDSTAQKVVFVPCPSGTRAIGGSAVVGGSGQVRINTQVPDATGYTVLATEPAGGLTTPWFVVVTAQCAPTSSLPGLEYRLASSGFDSASRHTATLACPTGKRLIGMGGLIDSNGPGQDRLVLTAVRPSADLAKVTVAGAESEVGYSGGWRASAVGVCVAPVPAMSLASASSAHDSVSSKQTVAICPAGTRIHAGGFDIGSGGGEVHLRASFLDPDVGSVPGRQGFEAGGAEDLSGYTRSWRVAAFGICAS